MITVTLEMTFVVGDPEGDVQIDELDAHTDEVFKALLRIEESNDLLSDADLDATLAEFTVTLRITGSGETRDDALDLTGSSIRTAIHTAGGATPGWRSPIDPDSPAVIYEFKSLSTV